MKNFDYSIPTRVHFGKGQIEHLDEISDYGSRILLVYGGGSVKTMGLYDQVITSLEKNGLTYFELSGVQPNPRIESVREGAYLCKIHHIEVLLGIGGGSAIDCAKMIAAAAKYDGDAWDLIEDNQKIQAALPIITIPTLAATGTEMDKFSVISDLTRKDKVGNASEWMKPRMSIMDPEYTYSVPKKHTAAGTADIMSHIFENYFTNVEGAFVQARFCESLLQTCIRYGPIALEKPNNYEARANLMWTASLAINGICSYGAEVGWSVHNMEHQLSAYYDITHGVGLAILTPHWMRFALNESTVEQFKEYGVRVWGIDASLPPIGIATGAIAQTSAFFTSMGLPSTLREVGIGKEHFSEMAEKAANGTVDSFVPLTKEDIMHIFENAL